MRNVIHLSQTVSAYMNTCYYLPVFPLIRLRTTEGIGADCLRASGCATCVYMSTHTHAGEERAKGGWGGRRGFLSPVYPKAMAYSIITDLQQAVTKLV